MIDLPRRDVGQHLYQALWRGQGGATEIAVHKDDNAIWIARFRHENRPLAER